MARIAASCADAVARDADAVVLYENAAKRRVQAFVAALKSLQALQVRALPPEATGERLMKQVRVPCWAPWLNTSAWLCVECDWRDMLCSE